MSKKVIVKKENLDKERLAREIQARLSHAVLKERQQLEDEGVDVPSFSLSVKSDTREVWKPEKYFVKSYLGLLDEIEKEHGLSIEERGIISILSGYLNYEDNLLSKENGDPLQRKDLEKILGKGHNAVDKYMKNLVEKGVLAKVKIINSVHYVMNPYIYYMGNKIDGTLVEMFKNYQYID